MKRKAEITFEIEETIIWRQGEPLIETFCPNCQELVEMAAPQIAAFLINLSEREIFRLIELGAIHFVETDKVSVCLNSLTDKLKEQQQ